MPIGLLFWILMVLWLVYGVWRDYPSYLPMGGNLLQWVVIALLGWQTFGPILR